MMRPANLRCEGRANPIGLGVASPRLSWEIRSAANGARQTAYHIQSSGDASFQNIRWDSGKVESSAQNEIIYEGAPLEPLEALYWRVRLLDATGAPSDWSETASFECGFPSIETWPAGWIAYSWAHVAPESRSVNHLRKEFTLPSGKAILKARAFAAATAGPFGNDTLRMNLYELRLNGKKLGKGIIAPGQLSERAGRARYCAFDIKDALNEGLNAIGMIFAAAKVSVAMTVRYEDGSEFAAGSDDSWRWNRQGPFKRLWRHDVYEYGGKGESYDARAEFEGWDKPGFDDSAWPFARPCNQAALLSPQLTEVIVGETLRPLSLAKLTDGSSIADFGRNMNGHLAIDCEGPAGTQVRLRFAEELGLGGRLDPASSLSSQGLASIHEDLYVKRGDGRESYAPRFANHGFRFVEITDAQETLSKEDIQARAIHADVLNGSFFKSSDQRLQALHELCVRTFLSNLASVPTDCPSRERQGWLADASMCSEAETASFDMRSLYAQWFQEICDSQEPNGYIPYLAPFPMVLSGTDIPWSSGFAETAWNAYRAYGEKSQLKEIYGCLRRWALYLATLTSADGLCHGHVNYNDHFGFEQPSKAFVGSAYLLRGLELVARIAYVLGENKDSALFNGKAMTLKDSINAEFLRAGATYDNGCQSANAIALRFGLAPDALRMEVLRNLVADIERKGRITCGYLGTSCLVPVLRDNAHDSILLALVNSEAPGSWGHWLARGATTAFENWEGGERISGNHPALAGGISAWLYSGIAGISPLEPGYAKIRFRPFIPKGVETAEATINSVRGPIRSAWTVRDGRTSLELEAPPNASAELQLGSACGSKEARTIALCSGRHTFKDIGAMWKNLKGLS